MHRISLLADLAAWAMPARAHPRPEPLQVGPNGIEATPVNDAVDALTSQIRTARQQAIADGVQPIPAAVYRSLLGYFPPTLLQKTRFRSSPSNALTLSALAFSYGDAVATTVGEVVLFRTGRLPPSNLKLWAHELTRVMQYQRWGIDGFADHYVRNTTAVEQEAIDNTDRFMVWLARRDA